MLARIVNGAVAEYPYTLAQLRAAHPNTSFPDAIHACALTEFGATVVLVTSRPAAEPGQVVEEGTPALANGEWHQTWTARAETPAELAAAKADAIIAIDADAEAQRLRYVTPGAAQQLVYEAKRHEAVALASDESPDPSNYPLLSAEIGITASTLTDVGAAVLLTAAQWRNVAAAIEHLRLGAKQAVAAATTIAAVHAAAAVTWPE